MKDPPLKRQTLCNSCICRQSMLLLVEALRRRRETRGGIRWKREQFRSFTVLEGGKSSLALGRCIDAISKGKTAIIIQFLKGNLNADRLAVIDRLEPELQVFRFEKSGGILCKSQ